MVIRAHDLLRIADLSFLQMEQAEEWAVSSMKAIPYVVVRRAGLAEDGSIPVGIRGAQRNQREAAFLAPQGIGRIVTPYEIAAERMWTAVSAERQRLPVLSLMDTVAELMTDWRWGPAGSAGFEIITGYPALKETSDLDIVIDSSRGRMGYEDAEGVLRELDKLGVRIDIQWETEDGAYILRELVSRRTDTVVLRTVQGPKLVRNPWYI